MIKRIVDAGLIGLVAILCGAPLVVAQDDGLTGFQFGERLGEETCANAAVYREYAASDVGLQSLITGEPVFLSFIAFDYATVSDAEYAMQVFQEDMNDGNLEFSAETVDPEIRPVSVGSVGDQSHGFIVTAESFDDESAFGVEWSMVFMAVRQGPILELSIGIGTTGSVATIVDTIEPTLTRWPTGDGSAFAEGIYKASGGEMAGSLFDTLPRLENLPVGFAMTAQGTVFTSPPRSNCR